MSTTATYSISNEGVKLLETWSTAKRNVAELKQRLIEAECDLSNATKHLGQWMVPKEHGHDGEQFNIWIGNGLLGARRLADGYHEVAWRKPPTGESAIHL